MTVAQQYSKTVLLSVSTRGDSYLRRKNSNEVVVIGKAAFDRDVRNVHLGAVCKQMLCLLDPKHADVLGDSAAVKLIGQFVNLCSADAKFPAQGGGGDILTEMGVDFITSNILE